MRRVGVSIVAAALIACAGGVFALQRAEPGRSAASVDPSLTVKIVAGDGIVTSMPAGIDCPGTCSFPFPPGTSVTLTATPAADFRFASWVIKDDHLVCTIQPTQPNECRVTLASDLTVEATFRPAATVRVFPNGNGVVTVSPAGIDLATGGPLTTCAPDVELRGCQLAYKPGTPITATAAPRAGSTFASWGDFRCRAAAPCTVKAIAGESSLVATFNPLELRVATVGSGIVTSSPAGINCGDDRSDCAILARLGARIVLTASPEPLEWRFGCEPEGGDRHTARCTATVAAAPTLVGVSFDGAGGPPPANRISIRLDLTTSGPRGAAVHGEKIDCGRRCSATYKFGDMEKLRPVDTTGSRFQRWIGGCGSTRVCRFPVGPITTLEAVFAPRLTARFVRVRTSGRGSRRKVVARVLVSRAASVSLRLTRSGRRVAVHNVGVKAGQSVVRLKVPARAKRGRYSVVAIVRAGKEQRRLVRPLKIGR